MTANGILLNLSDQYQWRARGGISTRQQKVVTSDRRLGCQPCAEASRTESLWSVAIMPSPANGDIRGKHWRKSNRKRGGHDG